jgi:spore coat polysaccharide biosynthesis protein SpsF
MTKVIAIIQARMSSTRLPGKVLMELGGKTVLEQVVDRTKQATKIDGVLLAIPDGKNDDVLAKFCDEKGIVYSRGSENDVLDRYYEAAKKSGADVVVRITSDCPLIDPMIVDQVVQRFLNEGGDYLSTGRLVTTYPDGLDTEVFTFLSLERAWKEAKLPSEREHVTPYIWNHPESFKVSTFDYERDLSSLRWTVDEPRDLEFVRAIFNELKEKDMFYMDDVLSVLSQKPELGNINSDIKRNSGYYKSLREEDTLG